MQEVPEVKKISQIKRKYFLVNEKYHRVNGSANILYYENNQIEENYLLIYENNSKK